MYYAILLMNLKRDGLRSPERGTHMNHSNQWKELKEYAHSKGITISYLAHSMKTYRSNLIDKYGYEDDKALYKELFAKVDELAELQAERKDN